VTIDAGTDQEQLIWKKGRMSLFLLPFLPRADQADAAIVSLLVTQTQLTHKIVSAA
jgi:hypothetical protein